MSQTTNPKSRQGIKIELFKLGKAGQADPEMIAKLVNDTLEKFYKDAKPFYIEATNYKRIGDPDVKWGAYSEKKIV